MHGKGMVFGDFLTIFIGGAEYMGERSRLPKMSDKLPKGCAQCANAKTVHLTQIIGGDVKKLHLCENCPAAQEANGVGAVNIVCDTKPALKLDGSGIKSLGSGLSCPKCGFNQETFKEFGRLGCPSCYEVFANGLESILRKAHRGTSHQGKIPSNFEPSVDP